MNFVVVEFGDNDFGHYLRDALRDLVDDAGGVDFCPTVAKNYIVEHMVRSINCGNILRGFELSDNRAYLSRMRVTFRDKLPSYSPWEENPVDHDHGSAYYDVNLDQVHSF